VLQVLESLLNASPEMVIDVATSDIGQKLLPYMFDYCHEAAVPDFLMKFFLVQVYLPGLGVTLRSRLSKVVCTMRLFSMVTFATFNSLVRVKVRMHHWGVEWCVCLHIRSMSVKNSSLASTLLGLPPDPCEKRARPC
jgi:hypothetical protein